MKSNAWIVLLAGVNLALLAGVFLHVLEPKEAKAQAFGQRYLMVTADLFGSADCVAITELQSQIMVVIRPNPQTTAFENVDRRDLSRDFGEGAR